jgi:hypothetical protein
MTKGVERVETLEWSRSECCKNNKDRKISTILYFQLRIRFLEHVYTKQISQPFVCLGGWGILQSKYIRISKFSSLAALTRHILSENASAAWILALCEFYIESLEYI